MKNLFKRDPSGKDRLLPRLSLFVFNHSRTVAIIWLCLTVFGVASYMVFLKREGFPAVNVPFSVVTGTYLANDGKVVDDKIAKPLSDIIMRNERVKTVQTTSQGNFYNVAIQFKEGTDVKAANADFEKQLKDSHVLPASATVKFDAPKFGFTARGDDAVISVYAKEKGADVAALAAEGRRVAEFIKAKNIPDVTSVSIIDPFVTGKNPNNNRTVSYQTAFDRFGERKSGDNKFYESVSVGVMQRGGADVIKIDDKLRAAVAEYNAQHVNGSFQAAVSASYATDIKAQISELQKALFEGLIAVLIIGSIVIAIRASIITVLSMLTVLAVTIGVLYTIGYTLNTITLFALILCLGLIVDDTIIMIEAIDARRRRLTDPRKAVHEATRKVSRAMVAATSTAALSFAPLLFVGGILGSFIRAIPITVITSLLVSLAVALVFIPFFARYLLLGKKQMGAKHVHEPAASLEAKVAAFIGKPMLWARHSRKKLFTVGLTAVAIGLLFIGAGGFLFSKVTFNIFPPSKDTNGLTMQLQLPPGSTIQQAEKVADRADAVAARVLGENLVSGSYFSNGNAQGAIMIVTILPYQDRDIRSPEIVTQLKEAFTNFEGARVVVNQLDVGPPAGAFNVRIETDGDRAAALRLAADVNNYLRNRELTRPSGEKAKIINTAIADPDIYNREQGKSYIEVTANFDANDTTTLVALAQSAINKEFTPEKVASYGLPKDAITFNLGQEEENQDSFKTLALAFPILLVVIYFLLALQFRSLLQPLVIFMAIPFSLFGITLGLYMTDNAFSFFAMLGFFALIGLSIKNTILLTDYANQLRRSGMSAVDSAVGALEERFRPLIATSFTAVVSLLPLALSSPFWEGLSVVLICGLLSSTFLVITVFPYYYLGSEFLRLTISRRAALTWLGLSIVGIVALAMSGNGKFALLAPIVVVVGQVLLKRFRRKTKRV